MIRTRASLLAAALIALPAFAGDWPRFRGPNGTGVSDDKGIPVQWTAKDHLFKVAIPGVGISSPIVSKGRVFVHAASKDGGERHLMCLDAVTGMEVWTKTIKAVKAHTHDRSSVAASTPAADGQRVVNAFWDGKEVVLHAYDFDGKELWKKSFGGFASQHGAGSSPILHDGKVYFLHDQDRDRVKDKDRASLIACLDATDGKPLWEKTRPPERACYSPPFLLENGGKKELIVVTTHQITAYNPEDGDSVWHFDWKFEKAPLRTVGAAVVAKDVLVALSGDGSGARHMVAVKLGGKGNVTSSHFAWEQKKPRATPYVPGALAKGEYLFMVNDDGFASCLTAKDGKEVWKVKLDSPVTASPVMIDGKLYICGEDGTVSVLDASAKKGEPTITKVGDNISATPAVAEGRLYLRTRSSLICVGKK